MFYLVSALPQRFRERLFTIIQFYLLFTVPSK